MAAIGLEPNGPGGEASRPGGAGGLGPGGDRHHGLGELVVSAQAGFGQTETGRRGDLGPGGDSVWRRLGREACWRGGLRRFGPGGARLESLLIRPSEGRLALELPY